MSTRGHLNDHSNPNAEGRLQRRNSDDRCPDSAAGFATGDGLRALLLRLHQAGPGAWRSDPEARALMQYAMDRYGALAHKHDLEPEDAAAAAFEAMLAACTRRAEDPWAVVTVAVRATLIAEKRACGLLTSTDRARRPEVSKFRNAFRFSDREHDLSDYHPRLRCEGFDVDDEPSAGGQLAELAERATDDAITLLVWLGWRQEVAQMSVDYVCTRLAEAGDRHAAYDGLRKDKAARAMLDLPHKAWIGLLRFLLGHPTSPSVAARLGVLARLLVGDTLEDLRADRSLTGTVTAALAGGRHA